jgi:hypothetical protein
LAAAAKAGGEGNTRSSRNKFSSGLLLTFDS